MPAKAVEKQIVFSHSGVTDSDLADCFDKLHRRLFILDTEIREVAPLIQGLRKVGVKGPKL